MINLKCPKCNSAFLMENEHAFHCSNSSAINGFVCDLYIWKSWYGIIFDKELLCEVLDSGENGVFFPSLLNSKNEMFSGYVFFDIHSSKFDFVGILKGSCCPLCNGKIKKNLNGYFCENNDRMMDPSLQCPIAIFKETKGILVDDTLAIKLLTGEKSRFISNLKNRDSNFFYGGRLYLDDNTFQINVDYNICTCPSCGDGVITLSNNKYACTNYTVCKFQIYKQMKGYDITVKDVLNLVKNNTAGTVVCKNMKGENYYKELILTANKKIDFI